MSNFLYLVSIWRRVMFSKWLYSSSRLILFYGYRLWYVVWSTLDINFVCSFTLLSNSTPISQLNNVPHQTEEIFFHTVIYSESILSSLYGGSRRIVRLSEPWFTDSGGEAWVISFIINSLVFLRIRAFIGYLDNSLLQPLVIDPEQVIKWR